VAKVPPVCRWTGSIRLSFLADRDFAEIAVQIKADRPTTTTRWQPPSSRPATSHAPLETSITTRSLGKRLSASASIPSGVIATRPAPVVGRRGGGHAVADLDLELSRTLGEPHHHRLGAPCFWALVSASCTIRKPGELHSGWWFTAAALIDQLHVEPDLARLCEELVEIGESRLGP